MNTTNANTSGRRLYLISGTQLPTHCRIRDALDRVRQAMQRGATPAAADVTTALGSCGCDGCRAAVRPLAVELAPILRQETAK